MENIEEKKVNELIIKSVDVHKKMLNDHLETVDNEIEFLKAILEVISLLKVKYSYQDDKNDIIVLIDKWINIQKEKKESLTKMLNIIIDSDIN